MDLIRDNALFAVEELERDLGSSNGSQRERLLFDLSQWHRKSAVGALLGAADVKEFRRALLASAKARRELLELPAKLGRAPGRFQCASQVGPFFDAVVGGDEALAIEIGRLSPRAWIQDEEYEDDFWYATVVAALLESRARSSPAVEAAAGEYARACDGTGPRLTVVQALLSRDQKKWDAGLTGLLANRQDEIDELEKDLIPDREWHAVQKYVFVEGLALAVMAEMRGLRVKKGLPMMPDLARR